MKNIQFRIVFLLALGVFILDSCNDPKNTDCIYNDARLCDPAYQDSINSGGNGVDTIAFDPADLTTYDEKIFLEEFTGFRCTNCPAATAQANSLKDAYPDRLFLSSIHCTEIFAGPLPPADDPDDEFQIDLRTTEGAEWYAYYEPPGLPDGLINRLGNEFGPTIASPFWADRVSALIAENNPEVYVNITGIEITNSATLVKIHATVKPIILDDENNPDDYYINAMIQEDGIVAGQKTVGGVLHNYVHNHVFRRTSNGPWGVLAYHSDINLDANTALNFQMSVPVESDWVLDNCNIVVVVSKESNREIIGLDEKAVTE